jgi:hypothetical protein
VRQFSKPYLRRILCAHFSSFIFFIFFISFQRFALAFQRRTLTDGRHRLGLRF